MSAPRLPVLRSTLHPEALAAHAARHWPLAGPVECEVLALGDNDSYLVRAGGEPWVLRVSLTAKHWPWGEEDVKFELEWLDHLARRGRPVAAPVRRRDGALYSVVEAPEGRRVVALFEHAGGEPDPFPSASRRARALGREIAAIHRASDDFVSTARRFAIDLDFLIDRPLERAAGQLVAAGRGADVARLDAAAAAARRRIEVIPPGAGAWGVIGGDFHGSNHHFTEADRPVFFDFDLCGHGWRAYDLAVYRWYSAKHAPAARREPLWREVLEAYREVRPLGPEEAAALPAFVLAREIWLLGEHVADIPAHGSTRLDDLYWDRALCFLDDWKRRLDPIEE